MGELRTERLTLRQWRESDLPAFAELNGDPRVMKYFPGVLSRAESDELGRRLGALIAERGWGLWAVEVPGVADFIGFVGLAVPRFEAHFTPCVEVGWRLAHAHWGRGYAPEAAWAALGCGFGLLGLGRTVSFTTVANWRSRAVMQKIGMARRPEDDFDHPLLDVNSPIRRHVLYTITREQFMAWAPPRG